MTAQSIGLQTQTANVLSGEQLDAMSETELDAAVPLAAVFYRVSPKNKLSIVKSLQRYDVSTVKYQKNDGFVTFDVFADRATLSV